MFRRISAKVGVHLQVQRQHHSNRPQRESRDFQKYLIRSKLVASKIGSCFEQEKKLALDQKDH